MSRCVRFSDLLVPAVLSSATLISAPAMATLVVGSGATGANGFPFGFASTSYGASTRYQQVYDDSNFSGPLSITGVTFYSQSPPDSTLNSGIFTVSLSTTSAAVDNLSPTFANNVGADNVLLFTGTLPALISGAFTLNFTSAFDYDPSLGNLLLDVGYDGKIGFTSASLEAYNGDANGIFSRMHNFGTGFAGYGLKTGFETGPAPVPEPATWAMMIGGFGLVGGAMRYRRGKQAVSFA